MNPLRRTAVSTGRIGEDAAIRYLESQGYKVLQRNYRTRRAEIDIVAEDKTVLVFVEVKTRSRSDFGDPGNAVTPAKQRDLSWAAVGYVARYGIRDRDCRFDIVEVFMTPEGQVHRLQLIRNAFDLHRSAIV